MADKKVNIQITADAKPAEKAFQGIRQSFKDLSKMIDSFTSNIKSKWIEVFGGLAGAFSSIKNAFAITKEAGQFNDAVKAMKTQFGQDADVIIKKLKEVSGGTLAMKDIVVTANRAMALNVTKDVNVMAQLLDFAKIRAKALGTGTTEAFNDIVTGIGRGSPMILDNLGIITKGWDEEAKAAGRAFDSQFILNKVLAQAAEATAKTSAELPGISSRMSAMVASIDDAKIGLGEALIPIFEAIVPVIQNLISGFSKLPNGIKIAGVAAAAIIPAVIALNAALGPVGIALTAVALATTLFIGASERARQEKAKLDSAMETQYDNALAKKSQKELLDWYKVVSKSAADADVALARSIEKEWDRRKKLAEDKKKLATQSAQEESEAEKKEREKFKQDYENLVTNSEKSTLQIRLDALNKLLQSEYAAGEERKAIERAIAKTKEDILEESYKKQLESVQQTISAISQIEQGFSSIFSGLSANRSQEIENEQILRTNAIQESLNQGLISEEEYATQKKAIDKDIAMKSAQQKRKDAEMNKGLKMFEIITSTASAIVNALATGGPPWLSIPLSVAIGALGAVQLGIAAAAPLPEIPAFAKGVANFIGGAALVGEQGPEIVNLPMGSSVVPNSGLSSFNDTMNARAITAQSAGGNSYDNSRSTANQFGDIYVTANSPAEFFQQMQQYLRENQGIA